MNDRMIDYYDTMYMEMARVAAKYSKAEKLKVGCIIVKNRQIISIGINGTPSGWHTNECETRMYMDCDAGGWLDIEDIEARWPFKDGERRYKLVTKPEVLHAEQAALLKLAKSTLTSEGATLYLTHSPCAACANIIKEAGISRILYHEDYRCDKGVRFLEDCGVEITKC